MNDYNEATLAERMKRIDRVEIWMGERNKKRYTVSDDMNQFFKDGVPVETKEFWRVWNQQSGVSDDDYKTLLLMRENTKRGIGRRGVYRVFGNELMKKLFLKYGIVTQA